MANASASSSTHSRTHKLVLRRRPSPQQGRGLEFLGHAIEYLIDSELHAAGPEASPAADHAVQILMRLSREVFSECREIVPVRKRITECLTRMFGRPPLIVPSSRVVGFEADTLPRQWLSH